MAITCMGAENVDEQAYADARSRRAARRRGNIRRSIQLIEQECLELDLRHRVEALREIREALLRIVRAR